MHKADIQLAKSMARIQSHGLARMAEHSGAYSHYLKEVAENLLLLADAIDHLEFSTSDQKLNNQYLEALP